MQAVGLIKDRRPAHLEHLLVLVHRLARKLEDRDNSHRSPPSTLASWPSSLPGRAALTGWSGASFRPETAGPEGARGRPARSSGRVLKAMPAMMAAPPVTCAGPTGSANTTMPATAPTSGSRLRKAPATSAGIRLCP